MPEPLLRQLDAIAEVMAGVLRSPPLAGQSISAWAKQQACRKRALETPVEIVSGFDDFVVGRDAVLAARRERREEGRIDDGLARVTEVIDLGAPLWQAVERFALGKRLVTAADRKALHPARHVPRMVPEPWQAAQLIEPLQRCRERGLEDRPGRLASGRRRAEAFGKHLTRQRRRHLCRRSTIGDATGRPPAKRTGRARDGVSPWSFSGRRG